MTLATHADGAAKQVFKRKLINAVYRNIPFGQKAAQLSYQHHLRLALKASHTSDEFILNLQGALNKAHVINTSARVALKELLQDIQNSTENLQKVDKVRQNLIDNADSKNVDEAKKMPIKHPSQHFLSDATINQNDLKLDNAIEHLINRIDTSKLNAEQLNAYNNRNFINYSDNPNTSNTPNLAQSTSVKMETHLLMKMI